MSGDDAGKQRNSKALEPELVVDPVEKARAEARNGLRQYDFGVAVAQAAIERGSFKLRPSLVLGLHREALKGISSYAGNFRPAGVSIEGSRHAPPEAYLVPELIEDMCDYVNENWESQTALHFAAYLMWRLNWIHPFADGNGRTSRILSYVVLCIKAKTVFGGTPTIPDQIVENRQPYFDALDAADEALRSGKVDVSKMEELLAGMLAHQLTQAFKQAGGKVNEGS
jgi:Fic family protein